MTTKTLLFGGLVLLMSLSVIACENDGADSDDEPQNSDDVKEDGNDNRTGDDDTPFETDSTLDDDDSTGEEENPFRAAEPRLEAKFSRTYEGTIVDGGHTEKCQWEGLSFALTVEVSGEMSCYYSEIDQEVSCDETASSASLPFAGWFDVENLSSVPVVGGATLKDDKPYPLRFNVNLTHDSPYYRETFEVKPEISFWEDEIEYFEWAMRHSKDNAEQTIWESCWCIVEKTSGPPPA